MFDFVVESVAAEGAVICAEGAVDADVELTLVVGVVGGTGVVVGSRSEVGWRGEAYQQRLCRRIERGVDGVAGELLTDIFAGD